MAKANKKQIKPLVSILPLEPKDIESFGLLAEFMVAEALAFSGKVCRICLGDGRIKKKIQCNVGLCLVR